MFEYVLTLGLAAGGLASIIRALISSLAPHWLKKKPWGCPVCLGFWATVILVAQAASRYVAEAAGYEVFVLVVDVVHYSLAAVAIAAVVNAWASPPQVEVVESYVVEKSP